MATITSAFQGAARFTSRRPRVAYYGTWMIGAAFIGQFIAVGVQSFTMGAFLEPMTLDLGWTRSQFTVAGTVGRVVTAAAGFFIGAHVDRHGARTLMLVGVAIITSALFAVSFVQELWQWILLHGVVVTAGAAMIGNLVVNISLSKWFVERRGMAIGWASMGVSLGGVVLAPLLTRVVDTWDWRVGWRVLAVLAAVLVTPAALVMRRTPEDHGLYPDGKSAEEAAGAGGDRARADLDSSLTRHQALRTSAFYLLVLGFGMFAITNGVMLLQTIPFVTDAGFSRSRGALMLVLASIPALVTKPIWGYLTDRVTPNKLASIGSALTASAMVTVTLSTRAENVPAMFVGFFLLGSGFGGVIPLQEVIWATYFGRRHIGAVRSAAMPFSLLIGAGAPLLTSFYFDRVGDYDGAFFTIAAFNLIASVLLLFVRRPTRADPNPSATLGVPVGGAAGPAGP